VYSCAFKYEIVWKQLAPQGQERGGGKSGEEKRIFGGGGI